MGELESLNQPLLFQLAQLALLRQRTSASAMGSG